MFFDAYDKIWQVFEADGEILPTVDGADYSQRQLLTRFDVSIHL